MRPRTTVLWLLVILVWAVACTERATDDTVAVPDKPGAVKTAATKRAERRAFDGAPPVIPHEDFGMGCVQCHTQEGVAVDGVGYAPPMPHEDTGGMSAISRCEQCHVWQNTDAVFASSSFEGLRQDLEPGERLSEVSPPVIPHPVFMRENCVACHSGPAAREEIRTSHPERIRCQQCHVGQATGEVFDRSH